VHFVVVVKELFALRLFSFVRHCQVCIQSVDFWFQPVAKQTRTQLLSPVKTIYDLVITANPRSPPLSVFVLSRLLADQRRVLLTTFVHSSARNLVSPQLLGVFPADGHMVADRNAFQIGISLIWKDGKRYYGKRVESSLEYDRLRGI
jgi:hypothetical protein